VTLARTTGAVTLAFVAVMVGSMSTPGRAHPTGAVTWSTVSQVLDDRCLSCHSPEGGAAPRLDGYEHARAAAAGMKRAVLERRMPPWYAVEGFGEFANDQTLTPVETAWIADWADAGAPADPEGGAGVVDVGLTAHDSHHAHHVHGDELVLRTPAYAIEQPSHTFTLATGVPRDRWVRGWEITPGNRALALSAVLALQSGATLGTWTAGEPMTMLPDDVAARLPKDSALVLTVKYRRASATASEESRVRLALSDSPGRMLKTLTLPCGATRLPRDIDALAIRTAGDLPGESLAVEARRPDRSLEALAWLENFPRSHDRTYWFRGPVVLPAGSAISVAASEAQCGAELEYVER
jgi:hypothetical protein